MKKIIAVIIASILLLGLIPALADAPAIESIEYEGGGRVEIDFEGNVKYKDLKLRVTDEDGTAYKTAVTSRDGDEIDFRVSGIKAGTTYKVVISGVKQRGTSGYGKVSATFSTPEAAAKIPAIEDIEVKSGGRIEIDFEGRVQYSRLSVKVRDAAGKKYPVRVIEKDNDELDIKVSGLKAGKTYALVIDGIRSKNAGEYVKLKTTFTTPASDNALKIKQVESDASEGEIEVEFNKNVEYGALKVTISSASGKTLTAAVTDRDKDSVELRVGGLVAGESYKLELSGVRRRGASGSYKTLSCAFTAEND
jgi:methionine-rich copper-binding protein CopC